MKRLSNRSWAALRPRCFYIPRRWESSVASPLELSVETSVEQPDEPVVQVKCGTTFYRSFPQTGVDDSHNKPLFDLNSIGHDPAPVLRVPSATEECEELRKRKQQHWAIMGPGSTEFLHLLRGDFFASDPEARQYPFLATNKARHRTPEKALRYVGFADDRTGAEGSYLSARYESWREATDWTVRQYLTGQTSLNPLQTEPAHNEELLRRVVSDMHLQKYLDMPLVNLSHGQSRRARIAKALMDEPEVLLIDNPFYGLDPRTTQSMSRLLHRLALKNSPRVVMALPPRDDLPDWITHLAMFGHDGNHFRLVTMGDKASVRKDLLVWNCTFTRLWDPTLLRLKPNAVYGDLMPHNDQPWYYKHLKRLEPVRMARAENTPLTDPSAPMVINLLRELCIVSSLHPVRVPTRKRSWFGKNPVIEMDGVKIEYDGKAVLGGWRPTPSNPTPGLVWHVYAGERWGLFGSNGSGKTTLLSLIMSEHPQAYAQPIKIFGLPRLAQPGQPSVSYFQLQSRIGHTSPEVHSLFPRHLSVRAALESAWADTPLTKPTLNADRSDLVDSFLYYFEPELNPNFGPDVERARQESIDSYAQLESWNRPPADTRLPAATWASDVTFGSLSPVQQKLVLFMRALIKTPRLLILDEPFSGMSTLLRDKCLHFLESGFSFNLSTGSSRVRDRLRIWHLTDVALLQALSSRFRGIRRYQALIITSHSKYELPNCLTHWMRLPGPEEQERNGKPARSKFRGPQSVLTGGWENIWLLRPHSADPWYYGEPGEKWVLDYYFAGGPTGMRAHDFLRQPGNELVRGMHKESDLVYKQESKEEGTVEGETQKNNDIKESQAM